MNETAMWEVRHRTRQRIYYGEVYGKDEQEAAMRAAQKHPNLVEKDQYLYGFQLKRVEEPVYAEKRG